MHREAAAMYGVLKLAQGRRATYIKEPPQKRKFPRDFFWYQFRGLADDRIYIGGLSVRVYVIP